MQKRQTIALFALALTSNYAADSDYSPTAPVRPSNGLINDYLREQNPGMAAWDLGVNTRFRYEMHDHYAVAGSPGSMDFRDHGANEENEYLLTRVKPRIGYNSDWFQVFVEGRDSRALGDERKPSPEEDIFDLNQGYVVIGNSKEFPLSLKFGRQQLIYGDERLVGASNWNNLGRTFDAAKLIWQGSWLTADLFSSRLVLPNDGNFNISNDDEYFSGLYLTTREVPHQVTDLYFLARNADSQSPIQSPGVLVAGASPRDIYTVGLRVKSNPGELGPWNYGAELMGQFGHFNDPALPAGSRSLEQRAYAVSVAGGYTWEDYSYKPHFELEYNHGSGDSDPKDGVHGTFDNLYPTNHKFYGYMDFLSLQNMHDLHATASLKPLPRLTTALEGHALWLADTHDNFYTVSGGRRGGIGSTPGTGYGINPAYDNYLGAEMDLTASYAISPVAGLEVGYGHFFTGQYIQQSLSAPAFGAADANWIYVQLTLNF